MSWDQPSVEAQSLPFFQLRTVLTSIGFDIPMAIHSLRSSRLFFFFFFCTTMQCGPAPDSRHFGPLLTLYRTARQSGAAIMVIMAAGSCFVRVELCVSARRGCAASAKLLLGSFKPYLSPMGYPYLLGGMQRRHGSRIREFEISIGTK